MLVDVEFSLTQHINGIQNLYGAMVALRCGRLRYKSGSLATLVLVIDNRDNLEKVVKFVESYDCRFSSPIKGERMQQFKQMLQLFQSGAHQNRQILVEQILPLWDKMRVQRGHVNQTFASLKEAQDFVINFQK